MARALVARGHTVTVLIPPWDDPGRAGQSWADEGVQVVNVDLPRPGLARLPLFFHILLTRTLVKQALARQPEVIHFFKPKAYAGLSHLALWWLRRQRRSALRLVVDADDWEQAWNELLPYSAAQKRFFSWQEQWGLSRADAVTVASRALEALVVSRIGVDAARVFYLPNGVGLEAESNPSQSFVTGSVSSVATPEPSPTILLFSRFAEFRLERIVTLVRLVAAQSPQARWLIVGRGFRGEEIELQAGLARAGLERYADFVSTWIPPDQIPDLLARADVAVYPYDDTLLNRTKCSVKLIDFLSAGLPVVADGVGQNCEYIQDGVSGLLTPAEDDEAFAGAVVRLLQEPATRQRLGRTAAQHIRDRFAWSHLIQTVEEAYQ
jgi:glycosyltransferase involved in cell wall biosynthesis